MKLQLTAQPISLELAESVDTGEDEPKRIVGGLIVPYGKPAMVGGRMVEFEADSIQIRDHVPLVLGHDLNRPIGVLVTHSSGEAGLAGVFAVDQTADGDTAIAQAKSGSRRGLSAGVDVLRFREEDDRMIVEAGELAETSQVVLAAYQEAAITTVAATKTEGETMEPEQKPQAEIAVEERKAEEAAERRSSPVIVTADREPPRMRLGEYVQTYIAAEKGDRRAVQRIEAALTREVVGSNPGVIPIAYVSEILDALESPRTLFNAFSRAELPPAGMTVRRPEVTARPSATGWLADDTAGAPTGPITLGNHDTPVLQWAWGVAASVALVERSSPSYVEEAFRQMIAWYYREVEAKIAAELEKIAAGTATTLGGAASAYMQAYGEWPTLLVVGGDAYGKIVDASGVLMFASGSADLRGNANLAGVRVVASGDLTPGDAWLVDSDLLESRESTPIRLSVSDVTSLSLEIGVTSFYALSNLAQTIGGIAGGVRIAGYTPPAQLGSGSSAGQLGSGSGSEQSGSRETEKSRRR